MNWTQTPRFRELVEKYRSEVTSGVMSKRKIMRAERITNYAAQRVIEAINGNHTLPTGEAARTERHYDSGPGRINAPGDRVDTETSKGRTVEMVVSEPVKDVEEIIERTGVCTERWRVKEWKQRAWTTTLKLRTFDSAGKIIAEQPAQEQNWYVSVTWVPIKGADDLAALRTALVEDLRRAAPAIIVEPKQGRHLVLPHLPDIHHGHDAPGWSLEESERVFLEANASLIEKVRGYDVRQVLYPVGHDATEVDNEHGTTTGGAQMSATSTWRDQFRTMRRSYREAILMWSEVAPVVVKVIPGNHGMHTDFALGECLSADFHRANGIEVDNGDELHKYHEFGRVAFMLSHGKEIPWERLPLAFATNNPKLWGRAEHREVLVGHYHMKRSRGVGDYEEQGSCITRISSALCPANEWLRRKGITSRPGAEAWIYGEEGTVEGSAFFTPRF